MFLDNNILVDSGVVWPLFSMYFVKRRGQLGNRDLKIYNAIGSTTRFEFQLENEP